MSSFKRKSSAKTSLAPGTRVSPSSASTLITSTGIPSLDDILGGGLPLTCSLLVLAPDSHSAYGELVQKYFVAQGLVSGQRICIVDDRADDFVKDCMWTPGGSTGNVPAPSAEDEEDEKAGQHDDKIKIAWRYEQMKKFQTSVPSANSSTEEYCRTFDLTSRIPAPIIEEATESKRLNFVSIAEAYPDGLSTTNILRRLSDILNQENPDVANRAPLRICIPALGAPEWGDLTSKDILQFLHSLRALVRKHVNVCVSTSLAPHLSADTWGGRGWTQKLGWLSDAAITLAAFTANPSLLATFPAYHGLLTIHTLPAPHTLLPPSDKFSTLRGLSSSGENNLAFKCMRKRLIFETLHLDLDGGVGERRTTPSANTIALDAGTAHGGHDHTDHALHNAAPAASAAAIEIRMDHTDANPDVSAEERVVKPKKPKKKVAFHSDRPDLYDF
ncbi:hypothetical protein PLICRDRAFT_131000 [Plicaturopsis crispa FD-325 SS-3]|nr:hypothetical protein PLICRDRAFT_131000 [Plicaturopsis crispa FD-325 SS-3]